MKADFYTSCDGVGEHMRWNVYVQIERNPRVLVGAFGTFEEAQRALARIAKRLETIGSDAKAWL